MANEIRLKRSSTTTAVPVVGDLVLGELALNTYDGKLFMKIDDGAESILTLDLNASAGIGGSIANDQIALGSATANEIEGSSNLTFINGVVAVTGTTSGGVTINSASGSSAQLWFDGGTPTIRFEEKDQSLDQKMWVNRVNLGQMRHFISNDGFGDEYDWMVIERSGTGAGVQVDTIDFTAATDISLNTADLLVVGKQMTIGDTSLLSSVIEVDVDTSLLQLTGGTADGGVKLYLYGGTHATKANDWGIRAGSWDQMLWDESNGALTIKTGIGGPKTDALTINSTQDSTFAGHISVESEQQIYFDGGVNTYIAEQSNNLNFYVGGSQHASFSSTGLTLFGKTKTAASLAGRAGFNIAEGVAPTTPVDGDHWVTAAGEYFVELNGTSVDLAAGGLFSEDADDNIIGGTGAGANLTAASGTFNFLAGIDAGAAVTTGDYNVAIGYQALYDATAAATGSDNVAIGRLAIGSGSLTSGHSNIAIGLQALDNISTGFENIAIGPNAMGASTGPNNCIGIGQNAGAGFTVGSDSVAIGIDARASGNSSDSVAVGAEALQFATGAGNVGIGASAMRSATGAGNVGVGRSSGLNITTGVDNTFMGEAAGSSFGGAASNNVAIGHEVGGNVTGTSSGNVMLGNFAGPSTVSVVTDKLFIDNQQRDVPFLGGDFTTLSVTMEGSLRLTERADHILTPTATYGEIWVKSATPNELYFTDDAGTDWLLNSAAGTGTIGGSITDNQIAVGATTADDIEGSSSLLWDGTTFSAVAASTRIKIGATAPGKSHLSTLEVIEVGLQTFIYGANNTGGSHMIRGGYHNGTNWVRTGAIEEVSSLSFLGNGNVKIRTAAAGAAESTISWIDSFEVANATGDVTFSGAALTSASTTTRAGLNVAEGVAPTSPVDGDIWVTAAGEFFTRLNGVSVDLSAGGAGGDLWSDPIDSNITVGTTNTYDIGASVFSRLNKVWTQHAEMDHLIVADDITLGGNGQVITDTGDSGFILRSANATISQLIFQDDVSTAFGRVYASSTGGNHIGFYDSGGTPTFLCRNDGNFSWYTNNSTTRMTLATSGDLTLTGDLVTPAAGGIDFSANTGAAGEASSLLDWYEEGSWTPDLRDSSSRSCTLTIAVGRYTRVGRTVFVRGRVDVASLASASGNARIYGLPWTSDATNDTDGTVCVGYGLSLSLTAGHNITGYIADGQSYMNMRVWDTSTGTTSVTIAEISVSAVLIFTGQYQI